MEIAILNWIQNHLRTAAGDIAFPVITSFADEGIGWFLVAGILLVRPKSRKVAASVLGAIVIEVFLCNIVLKPLIARPRPFEANPIIMLLIDAPSDYSFPSGHTAVSFATATVLLLRKQKGRIPALILAFLIAFSRLYLYVHYPSDVLVGAIIGLVSGWLSTKTLYAKETTSQ